MKLNFPIQSSSISCALILFLLSVPMFANEDLLTEYCKSQTQIESNSVLEELIENSTSDLQLKKNEKINGIVVSKNRHYVALDIFNTVAAKTSRIIVVSLKEKVIRSYEAKIDVKGVNWCADIGAIGDSGDFAMVNIAYPTGKYVVYRWCVVRLTDFSVVEQGLDRMLEKWRQ